MQLHGSFLFLKSALLALVYIIGIEGLCAQPLCEQYAARLTDPPLYHCRYTTQPPTIDGYLDDEAWKSAAAINHLSDIRGDAFPRPSLPTEIRMLWDSTYLYVAARLYEPFINATLSQRDDIVWHENDFEVFIDPDGDGINYYEIEVNALGTLLDLQMSHPYRSGGHFFSTWDCPGLRHAVSVQGTVGDSTDRDTCWSIEMAIPHRALARSFDDGLKQSNVWRMNFSRVEWLTQGGSEENWVWAPTGEVNIHMPERWAYVYLMNTTLHPRQSDKPWTNYLPDDYKFMWMLFYAQQDHYAKHHRYLNSIEAFNLCEEDWQLIKPTLMPSTLSIPPISTTTIEPQIAVYASPVGFELSLTREKYTLWLNHRGHFRIQEHTTSSTE